MNPRLEATFDRLWSALDRHRAAVEIVEASEHHREFRTLLDDDALARATLDGTEGLVPLSEVVARVADGARLTRVRAPEGSIVWVAVAQEWRAHQRYVLGAHDFLEGIAWALSERFPPMGRAYADALLATKVAPRRQSKETGQRQEEGKRGRLFRVRERIEPDRVSRGQGPGDEARAIIAAGVAEYLLGDAAWQDNGDLPMDWAVALLDAATQTARFIAHPAGWAIDQPGPKSRRIALFDAAEAALGADAFGTGVDSPRGSRKKVSFDAPALQDDPGDRRTLADKYADLATLDPEAAAVGRAEKARLRSLLDEREQKVLIGPFEGFSDEEIAAALRLTVVNVRTIRHRAREKLRSAL